MDCKWLLPFVDWLYCVDCFLHIRWRTHKRAAFRSLGMGNKPVHSNAINCPRQSCSDNKVSLAKTNADPSLWTKWTIVAIPGSFVIFMVFLPVYATVAPLLGFSQEYYGILPQLYPTLLFWVSIVMIPIMCLIRDFAWK